MAKPMPGADHLNPRTASAPHSIWKETPEESFRQHIVELEECTNAVPIAPAVFNLAEALQGLNNSNISRPHRLLSLQHEQQLADAFAFLAAIREGAQSVAAVCVEEGWSSLLLRFAAVDAIHATQQAVLRSIADHLQTAALTSAGSSPAASSGLLQIIVAAHRQRLLSRLRSCKWVKPLYLSRTHKKPLHRDFENLLHRAHLTFHRSERSILREVCDQIHRLASTYRSFEESSDDPPQVLANLQLITEASFSFCTAPAVRTYAARLQDLHSFTSQINSAIKCLHQVEKLAAYYRIPQTLLSLAERYKSLFGCVKLVYLPPYQDTPTTIGYEPWAKTCHIHAEVVLAVHYDANEATGDTTEPKQSFHSPRCIGTSKYLCYLCYLFLKHHGRFVVANTHGRLYDQWTMPDLAETDDRTQNAYRRLIAAMDREILSTTCQIQAEMVDKRGSAGKVVWRSEPMTSRENLLIRTDNTALQT